MFGLLNRIFRPRTKLRRPRFRPTLECLEARAVPAALLVRDLNLGVNDSSPAELVRFRGQLYFTADDDLRGRELWRTDGTTTVLVKDIFPGANGSDPRQLTAAGGILYFTADDGLRGRELWKTDGTTAGTVIVRDIKVGAAGSDPTELVEFFDRGYAQAPRLYFAADDGIRGRELWRSQGTAAGTTLVRDINPGPPGSSPTFLTVVSRLPLVDGLPHTELFYRADDGFRGAELWRTRGRTNAAPITTELVADINPGPVGSNPFQLTAVGPFRQVLVGPRLVKIYGGILYFGADDGIRGAELWRNDRFNGTYLVRDINPGSSDSLAESPTALFTSAKAADGGFRLFFAADNGAVGRELWISNGTFPGTTIVRDINPGLPDSNPSMQRHRLPERRSLRLANPNGTETLLFSAADSTFGRELWQTRGAFGVTMRVSDINPGLADGIAQDELVGIVYKNQAYFAANNGDNVNDNELWISNGFPPGTRLIEDVNPGAAASNPRNFETVFVGGTQVLFFAALNAFVGRELWKLKA